MSAMTGTVDPVRWSGVMALACATSACVVDEAPVETEQPIINGFEPNMPYHDAVVSLHWDFNGDHSHELPTDDGQYSYCSGILIQPRIVLTAAHCLIPERVGPYHPSDLTIYFGNDPRDPDQSYEDNPASATMLCCVLAPQTGGQTMLADTVAIISTLDLVFGEVDR